MLLTIPCVCYYVCACIFLLAYVIVKLHHKWDVIVITQILITKISFECGGFYPRALIYHVLSKRSVEVLLECMYDTARRALDKHSRVTSKNNYAGELSEL